ncbi:MAG: hypothetical protein R3B54_14210 [Bdellovibrionota bacterium]
MGLTSRAKQVDVNVDQAICGYLLKEFEKDPFEGIERARYIHPRAEPELVVVMAKGLQGRPRYAKSRRRWTMSRSVWNFSIAGMKSFSSNCRT